MSDHHWVSILRQNRNSYYEVSEKQREKTQLQTVKRCFDGCGDARKQCWTPGISRTTPLPKWCAVCELDRERKLILFYGLLHPGSKSCLQECFKQTLFGSLILSGSLLGFMVQIRLDLWAQARGKLWGLKMRKEDRQETVKPNTLRVTEFLKQLLLKQGNELLNQVFRQRETSTQYCSFHPSWLCTQPHRTQLQRLPLAKRAFPLHCTAPWQRHFLGTSCTPASLPFAFSGLAASFSGRI